jgi:hypothetical protein
MVRRLSTKGLAARFTPLDLDDLDQVAGGLADPDKNQTPDPTTQTADGAAFAQTQAEPSPEQVQERFQDLRDDFRGDHQLDTMSIEDVASLAHDITAGRLDNQLGEVLSMVRQMNPFSQSVGHSPDAPEFCQLAGALLERYADGDRPASLAGMMIGQERTFTANNLESAALLSMALVEVPGSAKAGLELIGGAAQAFDAAGKSAAADHMESLFTAQFTDMVVNRHVGQEGLVAGLIADGTVSTEQFRAAFGGLQGQIGYAYREFAAGLGGDVADRLGDPAVKAVYDDMVSRLAGEAASLHTSSGLADTFAARFAEFEGAGLGDELETLYAAQAKTMSGGQGDFFAEVLGDAIAAGAGAEAIDGLVDWAQRSLGSPWQLLGVLFDLPATGQSEALIARTLDQAIDRNPLPAEIGAALAAGDVPPVMTIAALVRDYDPATDKPTDFQTFLQKVGASAGAAAAAFNALVPAAVFEAVTAEAADGRLDAAETALAAKLLVADRSLPVEDLHQAVRAAVFQQIGLLLLAPSASPFGVVNPFAPVTVAQVMAGAAKLQDLDAAGPAAIAEALATMLLKPAVIGGSPIGLSVDMVKLVAAAGATSAEQLAIMVALDSHSRIAGDSRFSGRLDASMSKALTAGTAVDALAAAVTSGDMTIAQADALIAALATHASVWLGIARFDAPSIAGLVALQQAEVAAAAIEAGAPNATELIDALQADFADKSLIATALQLQGRLGITQMLGTLAVLAEAADVSVGQTLASFYDSAGSDLKATIKDQVASVLGNLVASGDFTAEEARLAARDAFGGIMAVDLRGQPTTDGRGFQFGHVLALQIAMQAELGEARLVEAAERLVGADPAAAVELREIIVDFRERVLSGEIARDLIRQMSTMDLRIDLSKSDTLFVDQQVIPFIEKLADAAHVFSGGLFVDILTYLGAGEGHASSPSWQFRDALRTELYNTLVGSSTVQAEWVAQLKEAAMSGVQTPAQIVAEFERVIEHAFARQALAWKDSYSGLYNEDARRDMRTLFASADRLLASVGQALFAEATSSAAARTLAVDWFRAQSPGGQATLLASATIDQPTRTALLAIAGQALDRFDWNAERARVQDVVRVGEFTSNERWRAFMSEQAAYDLSGAIRLAAATVESGIDPINKALAAWTGNVDALGRLGAVAFDALKSANSSSAAVTKFVGGLLGDIKSGEMTAAEAFKSIEDAIRLTTSATGHLFGQVAKDHYLSYDQWKAMELAFDTALEKGLSDAGLKGEAASAFLVQIDDKLRTVEGAGLQAAAKFAELIATATRVEVSIDAVLVRAYERHANADVMSAALTLLTTRLNSGATFTELVREVGQNQLSTTAAIEILRDAAAFTHRSFGGLVATLLDRADAPATASAYQGLTVAVSGVGGLSLADQIGADLAAKRLDVATAVSAVLEIASATKSEPGKMLAELVDGAGARGAEVAVQAIDRIATLFAGSGTTAVLAADAISAIRASLDAHGASLVAGDADALTDLASLYLKGAVRDADIKSLIDRFDGAAPEAALAALWDFLAQQPDSNNENYLQLVVSQRIADRVENGALFTDTLKALDAIYYSRMSDADRNAAYQRTLDLVEKAVSIASYAAIYDGARDGVGDVMVSNSQAHAIAETMVVETARLQQARGAFLLFEAAREANNGSGHGFMDWVVRQNGQVTRDVVLGGMALEMLSRVDGTGNLPETERKLMAAMQAELMRPEYDATEAQRMAAFNRGSPEYNQLNLQVAAGIAAKVGDITSRYLGVLQHAEQSATVHGDTGLRDLLGIELSAGLGIRTLTNSSGAGIAVSAALIVLEFAMREEAFREFIGPAGAATIGALFYALGLARSVALEGLEALSHQKAESANALDQAGKAFFSSLARGDMDAADAVLGDMWKNLGLLINPFDPGAIKATYNRGVAAAQEGLNKVHEVILNPLADMEAEYQRTHRLGISFL